MTSTAYRVVVNDRNDEFYKGVFASYAEAMATAHKIWWEQTSKAKRKNGKTTVSVIQLDDTDSVNVRIEFTNNTTVETIAEIMRVYKQLSGFYPSEEEHQLCRLAELKDYDFTAEIGEGYSLDEKEASVKKAAEILGVNI